MTRSRLGAAMLIFAALAASGPQARAQSPSADPAAPAATRPAQSLPPAEEVKAVEPGQPAPQPSAPSSPDAAALADAPSAEAPAAGSPQGGAAPPSIPATHLPHDLSPMGMFLDADWVVKAVMIGLAFASVITWTIAIGKTLELASSRRRIRNGLRVLGGSRTLDDARRGVGGRKTSGPISAFVAAADAELAYSEDALEPEGVKERVASHLGRIEAQAGRKLTVGTGLLATIGATAPFVGLFGTVWGIMNSFIGISNAQTTNLAVVAPGIAEALLATAIGLVAAIPAVVIYNMFARQIAGHRALLADGSAATLRILSRDLDRGVAPRHARRAAE